MELLNQIKDNFKILFLLPHGVILARKKRKKIKNVGKKTSNIYARFWLPIIKKTQFNEKWVKKIMKKKYLTPI